jgi:uncharacterized protein YndB with AHSA1/START domain
MSDSIELEATIAATPEAIFDAWVDGEGHTAMTGSEAESDPRVGGRFTAWGGYITGTHEELERPRRIVQRWRTTEFPDDAPDSRVEIALEPADRGTRIRLTHTEIPDGQGPKYDDGWRAHYFEPMRAHFG